MSENVVTKKESCWSSYCCQRCFVFALLLIMLLATLVLVNAVESVGRCDYIELQGQTLTGDRPVKIKVEGCLQGQYYILK